MDKKNDTVTHWTQRTNTQIESAVNRGLAVASFSNVAEAARMMSAEGVPLEVSARVLGHQRRRSTDWQ